MITPMTAGIALVITLIVFGPGKLPEIGRAIGKGVREFKNATEGLGNNEEPKIEPPQPAVAKAEPGTAPPEAPEPARPVAVAAEEHKPT